MELETYIEEMSETLKRLGWSVEVKDENIFSSLKSGYKSGHINVSRCRQSKGENQIMLVYEGTVAGIHGRDTRTRFLWNVETQVVEEMVSGSANILLGTDADIPEVAAEFVRRRLVSRWKEIHREEKTKLRLIVSHKSTIDKISKVDIGQLRGRRTGKKFGF